MLLHWVKCIQAGASAVLRRLYACGSADAALRLALEQRLAAATSYRDWCKCAAPAGPHSILTDIAGGRSSSNSG